MEPQLCPSRKIAHNSLTVHSGRNFICVILFPCICRLAVATAKALVFLFFVLFSVVGSLFRGQLCKAEGARSVVYIIRHSLPKPNNFSWPHFIIILLTTAGGWCSPNTNMQIKICYQMSLETFLTIIFLNLQNKCFINSLEVILLISKWNSSVTTIAWGKGEFPCRKPVPCPEPEPTSSHTWHFIGEDRFSSRLKKSR